MPNVERPPSSPARIASASARRGTAIAIWSNRTERTGLGQNGGLLPLDQREVDRGGAPRAVHRVHVAALVDLDVLREAVLLRPRGQQHLEELAVLDRHDDVEVGDVVQ